MNIQKPSLQALKTTKLRFHSQGSIRTCIQLFQFYQKNTAPFYRRNVGNKPIVTQRYKNH